MFYIAARLYDGRLAIASKDDGPLIVMGEPSALYLVARDQDAHVYCLSPGARSAYLTIANEQVEASLGKAAPYIRLSAGWTAVLTAYIMLGRYLASSAARQQGDA